MAEGAVVKEQLTDSMIDAGERLTKKLDENGLPITAALWLFDIELNEWRLIFASPDVGTKGPREVYGKVYQAIEELGASVSAVVGFPVVRVMDTSAELVRILKAGMRTGPGVSRIRFSKNIINGHFIDDALIYRAA